MKNNNGPLSVPGTRTLGTDESSITTYSTEWGKIGPDGIIRYPYFDVCWALDGYTLEKDYDNVYLGYDNFIELDATATIKAIFRTELEMQEFYDWWETDTRRGKDPFIVKLDYFGKIQKVGVLQESSLKMTRKNKYSVTLSIRIIFFESDIQNESPTCKSKTVYVQENTIDNYIRIDAEDLEGDNFVYQVQVPTAHGDLHGEPPVLFYTPDAGYKGKDCFSFNAVDYFNEGDPCVITIVVDDQQMPDHRVKYTVFNNTFLNITGNFYYTFDAAGSEDTYIRGLGGIVTPYTGQKQILENPSFKDPNKYGDAWELQNAEIDISREQLVLRRSPDWDTLYDITDFNASDDEYDYVLVDWTLESPPSLCSQPGVLEKNHLYYVKVSVSDILFDENMPGVSKGFYIKLGTNELSITSPGVHTYVYSSRSGEDVSLYIKDTEAVKEVRVDYLNVWNKIDTNTVWVRSNDHIIDPAYNNIQTCVVYDWGTRTNYRDYLLNQNRMFDDGFASVAGDDFVGVDLTRMFKNTTMTSVPPLSLKHATTVAEMFSGAKIKQYRGISGEVNNIENFDRMFFTCRAEEILDLYTGRGVFMSYVFANCHNLTCIEYVDTRKARIKTGMFWQSENLVNPDYSQRVDLTDDDGANFVNGGGCGVKIYEIQEITACTSTFSTNY